LLLALQEVFPSPLYIMDEVDASLDTATASRLGELIRKKSFSRKADEADACSGDMSAVKSDAVSVDGSDERTQLSGGSQFLIVSHRPEVQENAAHVIGVYQNGGIPSIVKVGLIDLE
jgi:chromosome segregation ATPase